ncbi:hypothetical protein IE53DRAFT_381255 [Violaceomyces palustris]|uniref:Uncharacterized protein n=1 Tax=Violaceomyces palustris TaxID=1673888 RepID=A0ACD0NRT9_9BASI|nr:hypothetical protein IE53DRAFT_381255 [Violaceomyces palustris]
MVPHPLSTTKGEARPENGTLRTWPLALVLHGTDPQGLERAARALPVRTATQLPEWVVIGSESEYMGYGGILGAGWFDSDWGWNQAMSYLSVGT